MFDFVRQHTKIMMGLMFLLIIPSFVMFGIDGYTRFRENDSAVARVGNADISQLEWDNAHKLQIDRLRAQMPNLDVKMFDTPEAKYATLERLVQEKVLAQAVDALHLQTSDARLARELQQDETIRSLRKPDGTLDMDRYKQLAGSQGLTPEGFEARVRSNLSVRQVEVGITGSGFAPASQVAVSLNAFFEKRAVQWVPFAPAEFAGKVAPTEAELEAFYASNQALFKANETASVQYLVLDLDSVKKSITLNEADVKTYYEQNLSRNAAAQERRASHILINAPKSASAAEKEKAKATALGLLAQARKAPEGFGDIAKKNSQDPGSAPNGGDLDFFARGAMVKPFEDAAYALKKGEISDLVESDFGFHIIKLTDIKEAKVKSFEESRAALEAELKTQQAKAKYAELAETFTNTVYEQADSLKPAADKLKLEIKTIDTLARQQLPGAVGPLANAKLLAALFGSDSLEKKRNTEAVETAPSQMVSARVVKHTPARTLPLAEVRAQVRDALVAKRSVELAKKEGESKLAAWKAAPASAVFPVAVTVSRDKTESVPQKVVDAVLKADAAALPTLIGVDLGANGYAIARLNAVVPREQPDAARAEQERGQYAQGWSTAENQAYYTGLKEKFKVKMLVAKPERKAVDSLASANP